MDRFHSSPLFRPNLSAFTTKGQIEGSGAPRSDARRFKWAGLRKGDSMKPAFPIAPSRRSFLKTMAAASGASLLPGLPVLSAPMSPNHLGGIPNGDAAILRFLAA